MYLKVIILHFLDPFLIFCACPATEIRDSRSSPQFLRVPRTRVSRGYGSGAVMPSLQRADIRSPVAHGKEER